MSRFIANSSSCTTTELSKLLTSCLTTIKIMLLNTVKKSMKGPVKIFFGEFKNSCDVINKLKSRGFHASSLSTYELSTLYTTCPTILKRIN